MTSSGGLQRVGAPLQIPVEAVRGAQLGARRGSRPPVPRAAASGSRVVVALLGLGPHADAVRDALGAAGRGRSGITLGVLDGVATPGELLSWLRDPGRRVDLVVLGSRVGAPLRAAERIHAVDRHAVVVVVRSPAAAAAQRGLPLLGKVEYVADAGALVPLIRRAAERLRRQQAHQEALAAANAGLARVRPGPSPAATRYLGQLLHHLPVGVLLIDAGGTVGDCNPKAGELLGRVPLEVIGRPLGVLAGGKGRRRLEECVRRTLALTGAAPAVHDVITRIGAGGALRSLEVVGAPLTGPDDAPLALLLLQDVTERAALVRAQARLDGALLMARTVAHEINNELAPVLGFAELLLRRPGVRGDSQATQYATHIAGAAQATADKVAQLQRVVRLEEAPSPLGPERPILDLVRSVAPEAPRH